MTQIGGEVVVGGGGGGVGGTDREGTEVRLRIWGGVESAEKGATGAER